MNEQPAAPPGSSGSGYPRERRPPTARESKAMGHPLRLRILRLTGQRELTNKQLADRLGRDPGTVLFHVRQLVDAGLLEPAEVRTGESGALEKPYRSTGRSWWINNPLGSGDPHERLAPFEAFEAELREAGPESVQTFSRFTLHLSAEELDELDNRILAVLDEYTETDHLRLDRPALGGFFAMHTLADPPVTGQEGPA